jgi:hypothetical protein
MKAYKFKSAEQLPHALDIIHNRRLFCSEWKKLNDPLEGQFFYTHGSYSCLAGDNRIPVTHDRIDDVAELISNAKRKKRICSLSLTANSILLWAHYASNYTGLVIEVDLPECDLRKVNYTGPETLEFYEGDNTDELANSILTTKFYDWHYEKEVRIIHDSEWYKMDSEVTRVICGPRMDHATYQTFKVMCESKSIPISRMHIDIEGIDLTGERSLVQQLAKAYESNKTQPGGGGNSEAAAS